MLDDLVRDFSQRQRLIRIARSGLPNRGIDARQPPFSNLVGLFAIWIYDDSFVVLTCWSSLISSRLALRFLTEPSRSPALQSVRRPQS